MARGTWYLTKLVLRRFMLRQGAGRIVNISSVVGHTGNPGQVPYTMVKAGLDALHEVARAGARRAPDPRELRRPGLHRHRHDRRAARRRSARRSSARIPLGRMGDPGGGRRRRRLPRDARELRARERDPRERRHVWWVGCSPPTRCWRASRSGSRSASSTRSSSSTTSTSSRALPLPRGRRLLPRPLPRQPDHAGRAPGRGDGAGRRASRSASTSSRRSVARGRGSEDPDRSSPTRTSSSRASCGRATACA